MQTDTARGARIIVENWMDIRPRDSVLIITEPAHSAEVLAIKRHAEAIGASVHTEVLLQSETSSQHKQLERLADTLSNYRVIIGATHYSMVTTDMVRLAVKSGSRFLSLPLATNDGRSLLSYDFLTMDTTKSRFVAKELLKHINNSKHLHVTTSMGTNLNLYKDGRTGGYFNGKAKDGKGFASSSFEVYVPIEETRTEGLVVLDGSLGYLGKVEQAFNIYFKNGRIKKINATPCGQKLKHFVEGFNDPRLYHATEFGIGTNFISRCEGNCYIEDESAYGTCHIGFGRNIALGGNYEANGHFDVVMLKPTIYADNRMIMEDGVISPTIHHVWQFL